MYSETNHPSSQDPVEYCILFIRPSDTFRFLWENNAEYSFVKHEYDEVIVLSGPYKNNHLATYCCYQMIREVNNETTTPAWHGHVMDVLWTSGGQQPSPGSLPLDEKYDISLTQAVDSQAKHFSPWYSMYITKNLYACSKIIMKNFVHLEVIRFEDKFCVCLKKLHGKNCLCFALMYNIFQCLTYDSCAV